MIPSHGDETPGLPAMVGPYRLESRIGSGGMGEVYRAYDERLDRAVAVKHIRPDAAEDPKIRRRLRREAHVIASLNHPAIVRLYDILESDDGDWIVMELLEGQTLHELVMSRQIDLAQGLFLASEVAEGLAEAHAHGIVHRDLKTENVMVTPAGRASAGHAAPGRAKILDFGLAKMLRAGPGETVLSIQGMIVGTGRAMSPEQARGDEVDPRSDLFSLGSLLYEVVTGRPPFLGSSIISTLTRICSHRQVPACELNPQVPEELSDYIDLLLEKDPVDRPPDTSEVAATLRRMARRLGAVDGVTPAAAPSAPRRGAAAETAAPPTAVFIKTLLRLSLHAAAELPGRLGDACAGEVLSRHASLVRELLARLAGAEVAGAEDPGAGGPDAGSPDAGSPDAGSFLLAFARPIDAVDYATAYHRRLAFLGEDLGVSLDGRVAVHLGELFWRDDTPAEGRLAGPHFEVDAAAHRAVARIEGLARPGQTLMTQGAHDMARRALAAAEGSGERGDGERVWTAHGKYRFAGTDETVRLFEVRAADAPALPPPLETAGVRRLAARDDPSAVELPRPRRAARRALLGGVVAALALAALWLGGLLPLRSGPDASEGQALHEVSPASLQAGRFYSEGLARAREGDVARARDLFRRAIAHDPEHALAHAALSEALAELDEASLAAESARRAYELRRTLPRPLALGIEGNYFRVSGLVFLGESRHEEARQALAKARDLFAAAGDHARAARATADLARLDDAR